MSLLKKVTSAVAALSIVFSIVSPIVGVSAAYTSLEAANKLATLGVIVDNSSNPGDYRLGDTITRREMLKVMMKLSTVTVDETCEGKFADLPSSDWGCKYAESALSNGMIAANANFRPNDIVSKIEALKMIFQARWIEREENTDWQAGYVNTAVSLWIISSAFSDYNSSADRGWIFTSAVEAVDAEDTAMDDEDDLLGDLLGGLDDDEDMTDEDMTDEDTTDEDTTVVSSDNIVTVSLSPETPSSATIPGAISGLPVAKFDFTAGTEDVTLTTLTLQRRGLSDKNTLTALAAFTEEGRASKSKNDSQENNTQAMLTLSNGGVDIMAGETMTLTIVADIASEAVANGSEFAIELLSVEASSDIEGLDSLVANTMKIGWVDAAEITVKTDSDASDVKVWDDDVEIFSFKVEGDSDSDVVLNSITFKWEGTVDEEDEMADYQLWYDDEVVASAEANGKYVTFAIEDGLTIREDKNEKFTVTADIVSGVTSTVAFVIDKNLDVSAEDTKYGYWSAVDISAVETSGDLGTLTIDAGELTLEDIDAESDKVRANKNDVELGSVKVTNVSGAALELQKLAVDIVITSVDLSFDEPAEVLENFEVEINGTSYELELNGWATAYTDTDLDVVIPEGVTEMIIRADTKENVPANVDVEVAMNNIGGVGFYVVETEEEVAVDDINTSSLTFKKSTFITSGATLSGVPLATNVTVVRGSDEVVANQFEVEAEEASLIEIDEIKVTVLVDGIVPALDYNKYINTLTLYQGSVSESNVLDSVSANKISAAGVVDFDFETLSIDADDNETFIVAVSVADTTEVEWTAITVNVLASAVTAEDDDGDDVPVAWTSMTSKNINVTAAGTVTLSDDSNNDANSDEKVILAGSDEIVFSADVYSVNEEANVETLEFKVDADLTKAIESATVYLDGVAIDTNSNSNITWDTVETTIVFDNLSGFIVPEENVEVELQLNTSTIGFEKVWAAIANANVTSIEFTEVEGEESGKTIVVAALVPGVGVAKDFDIVPATITPSVAVSLNTSTISQLKITADAGDNTVALSNTSPSADIDLITFSTFWTSSAWVLTYTLVNSDNSWVEVVWVLGLNTVTFDLTDWVFDVAGLNQVADGSSETFKLSITGTAWDDIVNLTLLEDGITYDVDTTAGIVTNLTNEIDFGSRTY